MFYVKTEIAEGMTVRTEITGENVFTVCPACGMEHHIDLQDIGNQLDLYGMSIYCADCTAKRRISQVISAKEGNECLN